MPDYPVEPEAITEFIQRLSLPFKNKFLVARALTHRSYINENRDTLEDNERLEFLGDAILSFIVAEWVYHKFPEKPEGSLTKLRAALVHTEQLALFARKIDLGTVLCLGRGEIQAGGRDRSAILCDAFEALIGALYLDSGITAVKNFVYPMLEHEIDCILMNHFDEDPKSLLQEWAQANGSASPSYVLLSESGPDHAKIFEMQVLVGGKVIGQGKGSSKQSAEKEAAKAAFTNIGLLSNTL
jgi:ribonuclease-3